MESSLSLRFSSSYRSLSFYHLFKYLALSTFWVLSICSMLWFKDFTIISNATSYIPIDIFKTYFWSFWKCWKILPYWGTDWWKDGPIDHPISQPTDLGPNARCGWSVPESLKHIHIQIPVFTRIIDYNLSNFRCCSIAVNPILDKA